MNTTNVRGDYHGRAAWWLRRAANFAGSSEDADAIAAEFQTIRDQNPLSLQFGLSVAPSSNINGGTEDSTFFLGDLELVFNPSSRALSGVEYAADFEASYRLSETSDQMTWAGLYLFGRTYSLSAASQASLPDVSGSDYALAMVEASLSHRRAVFEGLSPTIVSLHFGQVWYGGAPLWRYNRVSLSQDIPLGQVASGLVQVSVEDQTGLTVDQPDTQVYDFQEVYSRRLSNGDIARLRLHSRLNQVDFATNTYTDHSVSFDYDLAKPVLGSRLAISVGVGAKTYDEFSLSLDGRRDRYATVSAIGVFEQVSYLGFSPSWSLSATRTQSNVTRYSTTEVTGRLGIKSSF